MVISIPWSLSLETMRIINWDLAHLLQKYDRCEILGILFWAAERQKMSKHGFSLTCILRAKSLRAEWETCFLTYFIQLKSHFQETFKTIILSSKYWEPKKWHLISYWYRLNYWLSKQVLPNWDLKSLELPERRSVNI